MAAPPTLNRVLVMSMPLLVPGYLQEKGGKHTQHSTGGIQEQVELTCDRVAQAAGGAGK